jgi:hypothetical protein
MELAFLFTDATQPRLGHIMPLFLHSQRAGSCVKSIVNTADQRSTKYIWLELVASMPTPPSFFSICRTLVGANDHLLFI